MRRPVEHKRLESVLPRLSQLTQLAIADGGFTQQSADGDG